MDSTVLTALISAAVSLVTGSIGTVVYFRQKKQLINSELRKRQMELEDREQANYQTLREELFKCQEEQTETFAAMQALKRGILLHNSAIRVLLDNCDCPDNDQHTAQIREDVENSVGYFSIKP